MYVIELPWPNKSLSPNARPHWATKARAVKVAKEVAYYLCRQKLPKPVPWPRVRLEWAFHPKTAHALDLDNCIASAKAYQDGISLAIGIDDSLFDANYRIAEPIKGGLVRVTLSKPDFEPL